MSNGSLVELANLDWNLKIWSGNEKGERERVRSKEWGDKKSRIITEKGSWWRRKEVTWGEKGLSTWLNRSWDVCYSEWKKIWKGIHRDIFWNSSGTIRGNYESVKQSCENKRSESFSIQSLLHLHPFFFLLDLRAISIKRILKKRTSAKSSH